jgi:pyruvate kinase
VRRAKIVCTIGPASQDEDSIAGLIEAGMNVARLNFSHGTYDQHRAVYERIRRASDRAGKAVAILQDLQGPKIRVGKMQDGGVLLEPGQTFRFVTEEVIGDRERCSTSYKTLPRDARVGEEILMDDGLLRVRVIEIGPDWVDTVVLDGGLLNDKKGMNLPTTAVSLPSLTPKDRQDLEFGIELGVDFVALSFVRSSLDIHQLRAYLPEKGAPAVIAKVEKPQAVRNLEEIVFAADGVMVARGDLGVEMPPEQVPIIQKRLLQLCNTYGKLSITATQMLESMTTNPRPTRAEASDVANAIFDGTDAVMLSAETASGKYPLESVRMMDRIVREAESSTLYQFADTNVKPPERLQTFSVAIAKAATIAAEELRVSAIACFTMGGGTARLIKSQHPSRDVFAFTPQQSTYNRMALYRGITPVLTEVRLETDALIELVEQELRTKGAARDGDHVIIVMGVPVGVGTPTNMIKFHSLPYLNKPTGR